LIDAAVEMVTEYNASVPRCSRDRKKVQRARLLINLRVKQQQKERLLKGDISDDDSDQDESDDGSNSALHDSDGSPGSVTPGSAKKGKTKKPRSFASAEAEARAAEEALLLELEQEESLAQKSAAAATSKRSKKKKKKERERQQKLLEEKIQREKELKVAEELARQRRLQEEKEKERQRQQREREDKERELREKEHAAAREEKAAKKRREKEDKERRQRDQDKKERARKATETSVNHIVGRAVSPGGGKKEKDKGSQKVKSGKKQQQPPQMESVKVRRSSDTGSAPVPKASSAVSQAPMKKRGWETTPPGTATAPVGPAQSIAAPATSAPKNTPLSPATNKAPGHVKPQAQHRPSSSARKSPSSRSSTTSPPASAVAPAPKNTHVPAPSAAPAAGTTASSVPESRGTTSQPSTTAQQPQAVAASATQSEGPATSASSYQDNATASSSVEDQLEDMATGMVEFLDFDSPPNGSGATRKSAEMGDGNIGDNASAPAQPERMAQHDVSSPGTGLSNSETQYAAVTSVELPSVSLYRQEKLSELLRRCALARSTPSSPTEAISVVDEQTLRSVVYRWIVRASHGSSSVLDPIIPSWTDGDMLAAFFQRQLISESRRGVMGNSGAGMVSIEVLKEAGSNLAMLCQALAKDLADFRQKCEQQVPPDWSDGTINVAANEVLTNDGHTTVILIDWAGRSQVCLASHTFSQLRNRYQGIPSRLLTAIFAAAKRYDTLKLVAAGTRMDYQLPPVVLNTLAGEVNASIELWTGPLSVFGNNAFCGVFPEVDAPFGGLQPFGKEDGGGEVALVEHGGSVVVMPPLESSTAALYMRNILDALELADGKGVPLSFTVFLPTECFTGSISAPTINNLPSLDPRLGDRHGVFVRFVETLPAGQHVFACGDEGMTDVSQLGSLFVLMQNEAGKVHFPVVEGSIRNILRSTTMGGMAPFPEPSPPVPSSTGFTELVPDSVQNHSIAEDDYGNLGGAVIGNNYAQRGGRRGRLFELVEDGEEDHGNDVDVMSGMLDTLNVSMFQNNSQDVDIEAISLMGIGGSALGNSAPGRTAGRFG